MAVGCSTSTFACTSPTRSARSHVIGELGGCMGSGGAFGGADGDGEGDDGGGGDGSGGAFGGGEVGGGGLGGGGLSGGGGLGGGDRMTHEPSSSVAAGS